MRNFLILLAFSGPALAGPINPYVVQAGDSCSSIARRIFGDARQWRRIGEFNPEYCGRLQRVLLPGDVLQLPWPGELGTAAPSSDVPPTEPEPVLPGADARVTTALRDVEAKAPEAPDWAAAAQGTDLFRGWRVSTGEDSAAELTFRDDSMLLMRQNALIIIYGQSAQAGRRPANRARLERGVLKTRLSELAGILTVETEAAETELGAGTGVVEVDGAGTSLVARHDGVPAVVRADGAQVEVPAGTGSKVEKGKRPTAPQALPPAPEWAQGGTEFGPGLPLTVRWNAVPSITRYRIEVSRGADGTGPVASASVTDGSAQLDFPLPPGRYHVTVATVDGAGFESVPSPARAFALSPAIIELPGGARPLQSDPFLVTAGTRVSAAPGFLCALEGQPRPVVETQSGSLMVTCADEAGVAMPGTRLKVEAVRARVIEAPRRIKKNLPVQIRFRLESKAPVPTTVRLMGPPELIFDTVEAATPGEFVATFRPQASIKGGAVQVMVGDTELARFTMSLSLPGE